MGVRILTWLRPQNNPASSRVSNTPILDLLEPFPKPHDRVVTGGFATPFLGFITLIIVTENQSFLIVPFGFLVVTFLTIAVHEFGHLLAGWCVGFQFRGVEIGPVTARRIRGKWSVRIRPRLLRGQAEMNLDRITRVRRRVAVHILGGPVLSYAFGITAFVVGEVFRMSDTSGWTTFLDFVGFFSVVTGLVSTIPFSTAAGGNDAWLLRQILGQKQSATPIVAAFALGYVRRVYPVISEFDERWRKLVCAEPRLCANGYLRAWESYRCAEDTTTAAQCLERLLQGCSLFDEEIRNYLISEAAYFAACKRGNLAQSQIWYRRIPHLEWLDFLALARVQIAILAAENKYNEALAKCEAAIALLHESLRGPVPRETETYWINCRAEIRQKVDSKSLLESSSICSNDSGLGARILV
jgi:hypothetical protein